MWTYTILKGEYVFIFLYYTTKNKACFEFSFRNPEKYVAQESGNPLINW